MPVTLRDHQHLAISALQRARRIFGMASTADAHTAPMLDTHCYGAAALQTLMMIDTAITAQMGGGPGTASADLQAYLAGAAGKLQN